MSTFKHIITSSKDGTYSNFVATFFDQDRATQESFLHTLVIDIETLANYADMQEKKLQKEIEEFAATYANSLATRNGLQREVFDLKKELERLQDCHARRHERRRSRSLSPIDVGWENVTAVENASKEGEKLVSSSDEEPSRRADGHQTCQLRTSDAEPSNSASSPLAVDDSELAKSDHHDIAPPPTSSKMLSPNTSPISSSSSTENVLPFKLSNPGAKNLCPSRTQAPIQSILKNRTDLNVPSSSVAVDRRSDLNMSAPSWVSSDSTQRMSNNSAAKAIVDSDVLSFGSAVGRRGDFVSSAAPSVLASSDASKRSSNNFATKIRTDVNMSIVETLPTSISDRRVDLNSSAPASVLTSLNAVKRVSNDSTDVRVKRKKHNRDPRLQSRESSGSGFHVPQLQLFTTPIVSPTPPMEVSKPVVITVGDCELRGTAISPTPISRSNNEVSFGAPASTTPSKPLKSILKSSDLFASSGSRREHPKSAATPSSNPAEHRNPIPKPSSTLAARVHQRPISRPSSTPTGSKKVEKPTQTLATPYHKVLVKPKAGKNSSTRTPSSTGPLAAPETRILQKLKKRRKSSSPAASKAVSPEKRGVKAFYSKFEHDTRLRDESRHIKLTKWFKVVDKLLPKEKTLS